MQLDLSVEELLAGLLFFCGLSCDPNACTGPWHAKSASIWFGRCLTNGKWTPNELNAETREHTADCLASRLLLPTRWFFVDGRSSSWDLRALKARYFTASHELYCAADARLPGAGDY